MITIQICTNSFHGTIFSLIYERKFYSVLPESRAGRIKDLLRDLGLESHIVQNVQKINLDDEIDYNKVKYKIEGLKAKSIDFLKKGITHV